MTNAQMSNAGCYKIFASPNTIITEEDVQTHQSVLNREFLTIWINL